MNNADYGLSLQKDICDFYSLEINPWANEQFNSNYNDEYKEEFKGLIPILFENVGEKPEKLLTYSRVLITVNFGLIKYLVIRRGMMKLIKDYYLKVGL